MARPVPGDENPAKTTPAAYESYRRAGEKLQSAGVRWAAPSCVVPAGVADNCAFLAGLAPEVGLALFETRACLDYGPADLPPELADLGLCFHAHLPLDLPWADGVPAVWAAVRALVDKTAYLAPWGYVLHPPATMDELAAFAALWTGHGLDPAALLLENVEGADMADFLPAARRLGLSLCLDLGHAMAYNQHFPATAGDWRRVRLTHLYAPGPGPGHRHLSLAEVDAPGRTALRRILSSVPADAVALIEIFDAEALFASANLLAEWTTQWNPAR